MKVSPIVPRVFLWPWDWSSGFLFSAIRKWSFDSRDCRKEALSDIINYCRSLEGHSHEIGLLIFHSQLLNLSSKHSFIARCYWISCFFLLSSQKDGSTSNEFINSRCINRSWDFDVKLLDAISENCFFFYDIIFHHSRMRSHALYISTSTVPLVNPAF